MLAASAVAPPTDYRETPVYWSVARKHSRTVRVWVAKGWRRRRVCGGGGGGGLRDREWWRRGFL